MALKLLSNLKNTPGMSLPQIRSTLDRFNTLFRALHDDSISALERDLLLQYLREMYQSIQSLHIATDVPSEISNPTPKAKSTPIETPVIKQPVKPVEKSPTPEPTFVLQEEPTVVVTPQEVTPPAAKPKPIVLATNNRGGNTSDVYADLFEFQAAKELSDKLSNAPVADIGKAMGINERILTIENLFNKDSAAFESTITALNAATNFDSAKNYLIQHVIPQYQWMDATKIKKARIFLNWVRRRFA